MAKRIIPIELKDDCIEIYEEVLDKGLTDSIAVAKIKELLIVHGVTCSARTISRYLSEWKKDSTISRITEAFETDLPWQNEYTKEAARRIFRRFCDADDNPKAQPREIRDWASSLRDYIETGIKIDVIRCKKTTTTVGSEQSAKIVLNDVKEITNDLTKES